MKNKEDIEKAIKYCEDRIKSCKYEIIYNNGNLELFTKELNKHKKKLKEITFNNKIEEIIK